MGKKIDEGAEKADAIKTIAEAFKDDSLGDVTKILEIMDKYGSSDMVTKDIINMLLIQKLLEKFDEGKKEESIGETIRDMMKIILPLKIMQPLLEKKEDNLTQLLLLSQLGGRSDKITEAILKLEEQRHEESKKQIEELRNLLKEREIEEIKKEQERQMSTVLAKLDALEELYSRRGDVSVAEHLSKVLTEYNSIRDAVMKFAEEQGIKKEEIVTETGKINWGKILTDWGKKGLSLIEKYIEAQSRMPPPYTPPQLQPQIMQQQKIIQPQIQEQKEEVEVKEEKVDNEDIIDVSMQEEKKEESE